MTMFTDQELLARIEAFLKRWDMKPTRFGRDATGEASLLDSLRKGRSLSLRMANKVLVFMAEHEAANSADRSASASGKADEISNAPDDGAAPCPFRAVAA